MTAPVAWTDPTALSSLRSETRKGDATDLRKVAEQFESLFLRMMLKSMREAGMGDPMFDSHEGGMYRDMFDDQIAVDMSTKGSMGLADLLVRQLSRQGAQAAAGAAESSAAEAAATKPAPPDEPMARREFVDRLWPHAIEAGRALGVDPRHIVAQAALETGWGRAANGQNFFGIKSSGDWRGPVQRVATTEFDAQGPQRVMANFRAYDSAADSVQDYARLLGTSARYAAVRGSGADVEAFGRGLQQGGYATDPQYAAKLRSIVATVDEVLRDAAIKRDASLPITASQSGSPQPT